MKNSQVLKIDIEGIVNKVRFENISKELLPLVAKLETQGDLFGPATTVFYKNIPLCVSMSYADKARGTTKQTIFGFDAEEFMAKQYK